MSQILTLTKGNTEEWAQQGSFSCASLFWIGDKHAADTKQHESTTGAIMIRLHCLVDDSSPFNKVSEVIDGDGRACQAVVGKDMVYNGSTVILQGRKPHCVISCLSIAPKICVIRFFFA